MGERYTNGRGSYGGGCGKIDREGYLRSGEGICGIGTHTAVIGVVDISPDGYDAIPTQKLLW